MAEIYITGVGSVTPFGYGVGCLPDMEDYYHSLLHIIPVDNQTPQLIKTKRWSKSAQLACIAIDEAISSVTFRDRNRVGVVVGADYTNLESILALDADARAYGVNNINPGLFPETVLNVIAGHIAVYFQVSGVNVTISNGNLTGIRALQYAMDLIELDQADQVILCVANLLPPPLFGTSLSFERESIAAILLSNREEEHHTSSLRLKLEYEADSTNDPVSEVLMPDVALAVVCSAHELCENGESSSRIRFREAAGFKAREICMYKFTAGGDVN